MTKSISELNTQLKKQYGIELSDKELSEIAEFYTELLIELLSDAV